MNFVILGNGQVLQVEEVDNGGQVATIKTPYLGGAMERKVKAEAAKTALAVGEQVNITYTWQKFDLTAETWIDDPTSNDPIKLDIDGVKLELQPVNGTDTLVFSSAEPGVHIIKTENPGVDNALLEVTVNA